MLVFVSSAIALFTLLYWLTSGYLIHEVDDRLRGEIAEFQGVTPVSAVANINALSHRDVSNSRPYGLFDLQGRSLAGNVEQLPSGSERKPRRGPLRKPYYYHQTIMDDGVPVVAHYRGIVVPTLAGQYIVVGHQIDGIRAFDRRLIVTMAFGLAVTIMLALSCGAVFAAMSRRRIREINARCLEIMNGELHRRLPTRGTDHDLDRLAGVVNTMLDEIERLVLEVRGVCAGIAHDLRTPMTQLRAGIERVRRRSHTREEYGEALDLAIEQCDAVLHRFSSLLRIAEIEAGGRTASFGTVPLGTVLSDVAELYEPVADERGLHLILDVPTPVEVIGDADLLFGAVENLVDNAMKFTPPGGTVRLAARYVDGAPTIDVADSGPGIAPSERDAVLRPFYRSADALRHAMPGHGLGLGLVAAIAKMHGAQIDISSAMPGCVFRLRFRDTA